MSLRCYIYLIDQKAYEAGINEDFENFEVAEEKFDLDKAWHAVSYLITGDPVLDFLQSGQEISIVSESSQVYSPESVKELKDWFANNDIEKVVAEIDWDEWNQAEIYSGQYGPEDSEYLIEDMNIFRNAVQTATENGQGLFVLIY